MLTRLVACQGYGAEYRERLRSRSRWCCFDSYLVPYALHPLRRCSSFVAALLFYSKSMKQMGPIQTTDQSLSFSLPTKLAYHCQVASMTGSPSRNTP